MVYCYYYQLTLYYPVSCLWVSQYFFIWLKSNIFNIIGNVFRWFIDINLIKCNLNTYTVNSYKII